MLAEKQIKTGNHDRKKWRNNKAFKFEVEISLRSLQTEAHHFVRICLERIIVAQSQCKGKHQAGKQMKCEQEYRCPIHRVYCIGEFNARQGTESERAQCAAQCGQCIAFTNVKTTFEA